MPLVNFFLPLRVVGKDDYRPYMTFFVMMATIAVFVWEVILTSSGGMPIEDYLPMYAFNTCEIGQVAASELLIDATRGLFMNTDFTMFFINLLFLWIFAPLVEKYLGRKRFLTFYLGTGLAGYALAAAMMGECGTIQEPNAALSGVIAAFVFLYPAKRIQTVVRFFFDRSFDFPAPLFALIYVLLQFIADGGGPLSGEFLPIWDEIGGFFAGLIAIFVITLFASEAPPDGDAFEYLDD